MTTRTLRRLTFVAALAVPGAATAMFHLGLKKAEPAIDGTVTAAPTALKLWFSQRPELPVTSVKLLDAAGKAVATGALARADSASAPIVVPVQGAMHPGAYVVEWKTMAKDGHVQGGKYGFTLAAKH